VTPEAIQYLRKARRCLASSRTILAAGIPDVAAREAYLAGFHSAEAFVFEKTGKAAKTHRGLRSEFARATGQLPELRQFARFLARAYELRSIADYGVDPETTVSPNEAQEAIELAEKFVEAIASQLTPPERGEP
jgi:uncharacterized protein (UPF0332 family)